MGDLRVARVGCPICGTVLAVPSQPRQRRVAVQCGPCGSRFEVHLSEDHGYDTLFQPQMLSEELAGGAETLPIARPAASAAGGGSGLSARASVLVGERRVELSRRETVFGGAGADVPLDGADVADRHFAIEVRGGEVFLRDLGSDAGTLLNGVRVRAVQLAGGDEIGAGDVRLRVEIEPPAS